MASALADASVIVITHERPTYLEGCLESLMNQTVKPAEIAVVDSSASLSSERVTRVYERVQYIRNRNGFGNMPLARNLGVDATSASIVCFIDDDAIADPDWLRNLIDTFATDTVVAAGGRTLNGQPGEAELGVSEIGRLMADGTLTGNFAADPGSIIEVDHVIGCNMAFRRSSLRSVGGFDPWFSGPVRDETPVCLRLQLKGGRILFNPQAVVHHLAAPHARGRRFGWRYHFYAGRNHTMMLACIYGFRDSRTKTYLTSLRWAGQTVGERSRAGAQMLGALSGAASVIVARSRR